MCKEVQLGRIKIDLSGIVQFSALLGVVLHLTFIYFYFHLIGRTDLFIAALTENNSFIYLIAFGAIFGMLAVALFSIPSFILILSNHMFRTYIPSRKEKKYKNFLLVSSVSIVIIFSLSLLLSIYFKIEINDNFYSFLLLLSMFSFTYISLKKYIKKHIKEDELNNYNALKVNLERLIVSASSGLFVLCASLYTIFVAKATLQLNAWDGSNYDTYKSIFYITTGVLATFIPAYFYFLPKDDEFKKKIQAGTFGLFMFSVILLSIIPATVGVAAFNVAGLLGINDSTNRVYYLPDTNSRRVFLDKAWRAEEDKYSNNEYIAAKQLYSAGGSVLLCNKDTVFKPEEVESLRTVAASCLMVDSSWLVKINNE
ncbi:hypothetical protein ACQKE4_19395 [Halomonas sp. NPDC076908]|uniref:hypothetical protein n=1 Tax=Halomonas sp. NPDC076908 TaxID=3390567 RepID=UPI003D003D7C